MLHQAVKDLICEKIASGMSLRAIAATGETPKPGVICRELSLDTEFAEQYARARQAQADVLFDELIEIADDRSDDPASRRVRVDARKWAASKLKPKVYGDKVDLQVGGALKVITAPVDNDV